MARLLCVWEQGGQLGHLNSLKLPIELALQMGHEVFLAARELYNVKLVLGDLPITLLQAPFKQHIAAAAADQYLSYTHLIHRQCFSTADELEGFVRAWRGIFELVNPAAVMFDHSPTALIAALPFAFQKILIGQGFEIAPPPAAEGAPFAPFPTTTLTPEVSAQLLHHDAALLERINQVLASECGYRLEHLHGMYAQADHCLCMTWPALDPFGPRSDLHYLGAQSLQIERAPQWPQGPGARVFGYLQFFPGLQILLNDLQAAGVRALLCVRDAPVEWVQATADKPVRVTTEPVDIRRVAAEANWVISHANHSTVAALAGLPQLLIPRHQEQLFLALRLVRRGCAAMAFQDQPGFTKAIEAMQMQTALASNALQLQAELATIEPQRSVEWTRNVLTQTLGNDAEFSPI